MTTGFFGSLKKKKNLPYFAAVEMNQVQAKQLQAKSRKAILLASPSSAGKLIGESGLRFKAAMQDSTEGGLQNY